MERDAAVFAREVGRGLSADDLPAYAPMLDAFQRAHADELRTMIADLGLRPADRVLDLACGAGTYSLLLAEQVAPGGAVIGVDIAQAYLARAEERAAAAMIDASIDFQASDSAALPFSDGSFDLAWCAQSMYSLPDPLAALRELRRVTRPGGTVAVFENDVLHQVVLPWPAELEIAVRTAQFQSLSNDGTDTERFFIGRDMCSVFAAAGLSGCTVTPYTSVRHAPLDDDEQTYLGWYFADLAERARTYLDPNTRAQFDRLVDPQSSEYLLSQPDFFVTYMDFVARATVDR